jgi:hypothetical protein
LLKPSAHKARLAANGLTAKQPKAIDVPPPQEYDAAIEAAFSLSAQTNQTFTVKPVSHYFYRPSSGLVVFHVSYRVNK